MAVADLWCVICYTAHNIYVRSKFSFKMHAMVNLHEREFQRFFNYSKFHNNAFIYPYLFSNMFIKFRCTGLQTIQNFHRAPGRHMALKLLTNIFAL